VYIRDCKRGGRKQKCMRKESYIAIKKTGKEIYACAKSKSSRKSGYFFVISRIGIFFSSRKMGVFFCMTM